MQTILVTGAAGFIGSHVCQTLLALGHCVVGVDNFDETLRSSAPRREFIERLQRTHNCKFTFLEEDIVDSDCVQRCRPDILVHLAALAGVLPSMRQPQRYVRVNVEGTVNLFEQCRLAGTQYIIYASSSSVYGTKDARPLEETEPIDSPQSAYACTKQCVEMFADYYARTYALRCIGLRFFSVYGPRGREDMAIAKFCRASLNRETLEMRGDGKSSRDYTFVADVADGVVKAIAFSQLAAPSTHECINIGSDRPVSLEDLVQACEAATGQQAIRVYSAPASGDVPHTWADLAKARQLLAYEPQVSLAHGLELYVQSLRQ